MEKTILNEILEIISSNPEFEKKNALVFASDKWHPGVVGIVASRLVDLFNRPAFVISLKEGIGKGSGRSITDFNIYKGIQQCSSLLLSFGGHNYAAGISIREEDVDEFASSLDDIIRKSTQPSDLTFQTMIDSECELTDINMSFISQMQMLAPFGSKNPEPILCARNIKVSSPTIVGNNHLKMCLSSNGMTCNSIWFSMGHHRDAVSGTYLDIVFTPQINQWNGASDIQLKMKDVSILS